MSEEQRKFELASKEGRFFVEALHAQGNMRIRHDNFHVILSWAEVFKEEQYSVTVYERGSRTPIFNWENEAKKFRNITAHLDCSAKGLKPKARK